MVHEGLKIRDRSTTYINEAYAWDYTIYDYGAISAFELGRYKEALDFAETAYKMAPHIERLKSNRLVLQARQALPVPLVPPALQVRQVPPAPQARQVPPAQQVPQDRLV